MICGEARGHYPAKRVSAKHKGLLRMHADNLFGSIPLDHGQIERHSRDIERVAGCCDFPGKWSISFRLD